ncbi:multidrug resistance protein MdtN [Yersinia frederiksenii]|uniref:Multidrug resistance protein MdtN n=2 Tax=Yersinia frederiksenii TaxID=29484 RepID=A0A380PTY6_YERFR|nr:HlyD family secretion protein [Yersinia frederiksenii ATCC 33641]SUP77001.1 multidrug resistance protein MdtN [Yersinia frederiksenii]
MKMNKLQGSGGKRQLALIVAGLIVVAAVISGWLSVRQTTLNPLAEDAELGASVVHVSSSVPGRIISLNVEENSKVQRGDLLFSIEPDLYRFRVEQAQAELKMAQAAQDTQQRTVVAEQSNAAITDEQIVRARANLKLATQTLARLQPLLPKGYVTVQQVDDAATAKHDAEVSLNQALKQSLAAEALVSTTAASEALVVARRAALAIAERELANTQIRAPHDGRVVGLTVSAGEFVIPDQAIFTLINTEHWHASAFFRETELKNISVGDCATVYVMADRQRAIQGRVEGIGWGVSSEDLLNIPRGLPYVPKSLNWVRVVQRFPVRISLDNPPEELMRVGATAVVVVRNDDGC